MSLNHSIAETSAIRNFLLSLSFAFYFSKSVFRHIEEFIIAAVQAGYRGKVVDIAALSYTLCHRTTYGKFLSNGVWKQEYAWRAIRKEAITRVYQKERFWSTIANGGRLKSFAARPKETLALTNIRFVLHKPSTG